MKAFFEKLGLGDGTANLLIWVALGVIMLLVVAFLVVWLIRLVRPNLNMGQNNRTGRPQRLAITDAFTFDRDGRRLVIIRRDNTEHLLLIGGPNDLVVEANIQRTERAPQRGGRIPDMETALAMDLPEPGENTRADLNLPPLNFTSPANRPVLPPVAPMMMPAAVVPPTIFHAGGAGGGSHPSAPLPLGGMQSAAAPPAFAPSALPPAPPPAAPVFMEPSRQMPSVEPFSPSSPHGQALFDPMVAGPVPTQAEAGALGRTAEPPAPQPAPRKSFRSFLGVDRPGETISRPLTDMAKRLNEVLQKPVGNASYAPAGKTQPSVFGLPERDAPLPAQAQPDSASANLVVSPAAPSPQDLAAPDEARADRLGPPFAAPEAFAQTGPAALVGASVFEPPGLPAGAPNVMPPASPVLPPAPPEVSRVQAMPVLTRPQILSVSAPVASMAPVQAMPAQETTPTQETTPVQDMDQIEQEMARLLGRTAPRKEGA